MAKKINLGSLNIESIDNVKKDANSNVFLITILTYVYQHLYYTQSKLWNMYFTFYLGEYLEKNYPHIKVGSPNPGLVYTEIAVLIRSSYLEIYLQNIFLDVYVYS